MLLYNILLYLYIVACFLRQKSVFWGIVMNVPFSPPDISELEINYVAEVLRSGWITTGPKTKELEKRVKSLCDVDGAVCLNSQTACAEMALRLLGVGKGDEVITSAYTYTASASVIDHVGAKIVLIDTNADSRITRVGKFIRKCRLDEISQLIDVFRGKMTFVRDGCIINTTEKSIAFSGVVTV